MFGHRSQRQTFMQEGYLVLPSLVPMSLIDNALRRINHDLGTPGSMIEGGVEGAAKLAGHTSNSAAILDLYFQSPVHAMVESIVGNNHVVPPQGAQVALRFPSLGAYVEPLGTEWHTDGMRQGKAHPFSLLVGIALSEVRTPQSGNLIVFPKSHHVLHAMMMLDDRGPDKKAQPDDDGHKWSTLTHSCCAAESVWGNGELPNLGTPVQLLCHKGDVILCHPKLAHRGGPNFSPGACIQNIDCTASTVSIMQRVTVVGSMNFPWSKRSLIHPIIGFHRMKFLRWFEFHLRTKNNRLGGTHVKKSLLERDKGNATSQICKRILLDAITDITFRIMHLGNRCESPFIEELVNIYLSLSLYRSPYL
jgi:hypothetical protein